MDRVGSMMVSVARATRGAIALLTAYRLRALLVAALLAACVVVLCQTEYGPFATSLSLLTLVFITGLGIAVFGRPGIAAALSLIAMLALIAASQLKFDVTQLTLTFLDFLLIDPDTFSFLVTIHQGLRWKLALGAAVTLPLLALIYLLDPFRIRRRVALSGAGVALLGMIGLSVANPEQPWEPFQGVNHISNLARSGVAAVSHLAANGWMEAEPKSILSAAHASPIDTCDTNQRRPHIILLLDELSFDVSKAPGIKVPDGYTDFFKSADGKTRAFVAEATGGPTWYTEFNVLTGLSAQSFGKMRYYVTRIAAGHITRGLPQSLKRCGYHTFSLYPSYGNFLSARSFQHSTGIGGFVDAADMKAADEQQPDTFYFDQALRLFEREQPKGAPLFAFVYLSANHFPVDDHVPTRSDARLARTGQHGRGRRVHSPAGDDEGCVRGFRRVAEDKISERRVPDRALRRPPAGDLAEADGAGHFAGGSPQAHDARRPALFCDLLRARRHQLPAEEPCLGAADARCRVSADRRAGSRRPAAGRELSPSRSASCSAAAACSTAAATAPRRDGSTGS